MISTQEILSVASLGVALVSAPSEAQAYLDAGTDSMIVQVVIASIAGAAVRLRLYWGRSKAKLTGRSSSDDESIGSPPGSESR